MNSLIKFSVFVFKAIFYSNISFTFYTGVRRFSILGVGMGVGARVANLGIDQLMGALGEAQCISNLLGGGYPGWSESSLGAHAILLVLSRCGSYNWSSIHSEHSVFKHLYNMLSFNYHKNWKLSVEDLVLRITEKFCFLLRLQLIRLRLKFDHTDFVTVLSRCTLYNYIWLKCQE